MPRWWFQASENYFCLGHLNSLIIIFLYKCPFMVFNENENAKGIEVNHEPVNWGGEIYTNSTPWARKCDEFGSLQHAKLI